MTLWSLKTYKSNCSKTKSYQIQSGCRPLFVFLAIRSGIGPSHQEYFQAVSLGLALRVLDLSQQFLCLPSQSISSFTPMPDTLKQHCQGFHTSLILRYGSRRTWDEEGDKGDGREEPSLNKVGWRLVGFSTNEKIVEWRLEITAGALLNNAM